MSETEMWLLPVCFLALAGLYFGIKSGFRWSWGMCLQQGLILLSCLVGFYLLYAPQAVLSAADAHRAADYCAGLSWILFGVFNIVQRVALDKLTVELSLHQIPEARRRAKSVRLLAWGPPGQYWTTTVEAVSLYNNGDTAGGDALLQQWQNDARMPLQAKQRLLGFFMLGRAIHADWAGVTDMFAQHQDELMRSHAYMPLQLAARAFGEQQLYSQSLACLIGIFDTPAQMSATAIAINFVPFLSLCGAPVELEEVLAKIKDKQSLPEYSRLYWLARGYAVSGQNDRAVSLLKQAIQATPEHLAVWRSRIERQLQWQLASTDASSPPSPASAPPQIVAEAMRVYHRWHVTGDIVRPRHAGAGLIVLMTLLILTFVLSNPYMFFHKIVSLPSQEFLAGVQGAIGRFGQLDGNLWKGEWWRLITYMFLHGNTAHLALNTGAFYLFGKTVENLYGTPKFCIIFFGAGILSGLLQILALPNEPAIGASGAILGVFGAAIAGIYKLKKVLPPNIRKSELRWMVGVALLQLVVDQLINYVASATDKSGQGMRIAAFAHFGGIVAGCLLGILLPLKKREEVSAVDSGQNRS